MRDVAIPISTTFDAKGIRQAEAALKKTQTMAEKFTNGVERASRVATVGLAALGYGAVKAAQAAANLAETQSKVGVVFGAAASEVEAFAREAGKSLGMSRQAALDAAGTFGIFAKSAGLAGTEASSFATEMTTLAGDMASFNNTSPEDAIVAIGAALRGEQEPIRRFGVLLDDATLRASALRLGLIKTTKEALSPQQKVLAAQAEILKQTSLQQGDFARTSSSAANQQKILKAELANLQTEIGGKLLPAFKAVLSVIRAVVDFTTRHKTAAMALGAAVASLAAAVVVLNAGLKVTAFVTKNLPFVKVALAVAALVAAFVVLYRSSETVRDAIGKLGELAGRAARFMADVFQKAAVVVTSSFAALLRSIANVVGALGFIPGIGDTFLNAASKIRSAAEAVAGFSKRVGALNASSFSGLVTGAKAAGAAVTAGFNTGLDGGDTGGGGGGGPAAKVKKALDKAKAVADRFREKLSSAFGRLGSDALRAFDAKTSKLTGELQARLTASISRITSRAAGDIRALRSRLAGELAGIEAGRVALTPAEAALELAEAARTESRAARELADAEHELAAARKETDQAAILRAEQRLADLREDRALESLQRQAAAERQARDRQAEEGRKYLEGRAEAEEAAIEQRAEHEREAAENAYTEELKQLEARQELRRRHLEDQLKQLDTFLAAHPEKWETAHEKLMALFKDVFGPDYLEAGALLGDAFATGLRIADAAAARAAAGLAAATGRAGGPTAPPLGVTVTVNAGIGTDGAQVGRQVASALRDWQRSSGNLGLRMAT